MRVYRCIKLQEVINKYKNKTNEKFDNNRLNTHKYRKGKEYIHFFRYNDFAEYYFNLGKDGSYDKENDNYVLFMTANIPNDILERFKGFGFYTVGNETIPIPEYAIPIEYFSPEFIVDITNKPMGFYSRKNEKSEYERYMQLVKKLKSSGQNIKNITKLLLNSNFEELLGINIDIRTEEEILKEVELLLSEMGISNNNDIPIEEFKRK